MGEGDKNLNQKGLGITHYTWDEAKSALFKHLENKKPIQIVTLTPEMCVRAYEDEDFRKIITSAGIVIADGVGVVWGEGKLTGKKPEKIPGIEFAASALDYLNEKKGKVYLLGSRPAVVSEAAAELQVKYSGLDVTGWRDGYFDSAQEKGVVEKIAETESNLVLVGMGSPKQEEFIHRNLKKLNCGVAIGVGGSFDVWSGNVKRAPDAFQKMGLEWLYRTTTQPGSRMGRLSKLVKFTSLVVSGKMALK